MYTEWQSCSLSFKLGTVIEQFSYEVVRLPLGRRDGIMVDEALLQTLC